MSDQPEDDADRLRRDPMLIAIENAAEAAIAAAQEAKEYALSASDAVDRLIFEKTYDPPAKGNGHREPFIKNKPKADDKPSLGCVAVCRRREGRPTVTLHQVLFDLFDVEAF